MTNISKYVIIKSKVLYKDEVKDYVRHEVVAFDSKQMRKIKVEIKKSAIDGFGAFTKASVRNGELITIEREPKVVPDGEDASWYYVNHRCLKPNLVVESCDGRKTVTLNIFRAIYDIQPGEELTIDYRTLDWKCHFSALLAHGCQCPDCKNG